MDPTRWGLFAWQAGWVFTLRSLDLATRADGAAELTRLAMEKQRAFADGWVAAGQAALRGADPAAVMAAAVRPAQRRVSANLRAIRRGKA
ncbi:hypothetical protein [Muricoccus radiodurans]|uniref:hypothetical protein n=1 Tax=Muricoccus radiodurans TaxID=2231721 RepID=UPI003CEF32B3